jgi:predicted molibdopterin-dependent oxidoreductase YjgC
VLFEAGKCIRCGLCVEITRSAGEELGLTFVNRGFDVRVAVPLGGTLEQGLRISAQRCVEACPTGALVFPDQEERKVCE